ncbi:translation initiation factor IF-2-like [Telopea speciosissima]|uniref:translation initiation factor IF-2-like n=1 Tax=Telopea speciosissima TaxID=54955 RepID=UPI001CC5BF45|nr:translation initiation factor IF-2-like [Telopea speciosissima]
MPAQGDKPLKKQEAEDEEDKRSLSTYRKKSVNGSAESRSKVAKVKKEEPSEDGEVSDVRKNSKKVVKKEEDEDLEDEKPLSSSLAEKKKKSMNGSVSQGKVKKEGAKVDKKKKKKKMQEEDKKKAAAAEQNNKKERKVFDLPGQKRVPPEERDPLRIFYETLYQQLPKSEMAAFWMMESGLLPLQEAKKVYEKKLKRNQEQKLRSPVKAIASVKKTVNSVTVKKAKASTSPASSAKKKSVVESKTVSTTTVSKKSNKRKSRDDDSDISDDDFVLAKKKKKPRAT